MTGNGAGRSNTMPFRQQNPPDLEAVAHRGCLPGERRARLPGILTADRGGRPPLTRPPEVVCALLSEGDGVLSWRLLGASATPEVSVTFTRICAEVAWAKRVGASHYGEVRGEGTGEVVEAYIVYDEGPCYLVARLPIEADVPEWAV